MFKQKGQDDNPFGVGQSQKKEEFKPIPKPDIHEILKLAGVKDLALDQDEEQDQAQGQDQGRRRRGTRPLCCCGVAGCGIGPMTRTQETEE